MKTLILLRGLPGSGKSTVAEMLSEWNFAADNYPGLYDGGFHMELLGKAHQWCLDSVELAMEDADGKQDSSKGGHAKAGVPLVVHNTLTTERELKPYYDLAAKYGYRVVSMIVENRHGSESVHNVPDETLQRMRDRFVVKL